MKFNLEEIKDLCKPDGGRFKVNSESQAFDFCKIFANSHYENFPVGSILVPKKHRKHFFSVYTYSRVADDISDEPFDITKDERIELLEKFYSMIENEPQGNPLFWALKTTNKDRNIPNLPYRKLIDAFIMDSNFKQAKDWGDILHYCKHSANPVGELVLRIYGEYNDATIKYSDAICTGLQLVNFWQDISRDKKIGRFYIPKNLLQKYNLNNNIFFDKDYKYNELLESCLIKIYDYTQEFFIFGKNLVNQIKSIRLRKEISFTIAGGLKVLEKTKSLGTEIIEKRPKLSKKDFLFLMLSSIIK